MFFIPNWSHAWLSLLYLDVDMEANPPPRLAICDLMEFFLLDFEGHSRYCASLLFDKAKVTNFGNITKFPGQPENSRDTSLKRRHLPTLKMLQKIQTFKIHRIQEPKNIKELVSFCFVLTSQI